MPWVAGGRQVSKQFVAHFLAGLTRGAWLPAISIVGIPPGIVPGRFLLVAFVHEIDVVPQPSVPASWVALVAIGGSFPPVSWLLSREELRPIYRLRR